MRKFIQNIFFTLLIVLITALILDKLYTYIHYHGAPRNKPDYIMSLSENDTLDYAVFGSSRVLHTIDIDLIENQTLKKGFNFGIPGSSVFEIKLSVQQIIKKKLTKNIYIQIDYIWNEFYSGGESEVDWLTYINEKDIWKEFEKIDRNNEYLKYKKIPYFRYCKYGSKLGFRELAISLSNKEMKVIAKKGFDPLYGVIKDKKSLYSYKLKIEFNSHIKEIIELCKKENVNLYFFTSPIYNFTGNNDVLKKNLPNYSDFTISISNSAYFLDNTHLNNNGSELFTLLFIDKYFK